MNKIKEQAEIYRIGLMLGIFKVSDVLAWCDSIIMAKSSPDIAIIETTMAGSKGINAVIHALSEVSGEFDKQSVVKQILGVMYYLLNQDRKQAPHIARCLYSMAMYNDAPGENAEADMWRFWDAIDLALDGYYGDVEELTDELLKFLEKYSVVSP